MHHLSCRCIYFVCSSIFELHWFMSLPYRSRTFLKFLYHPFLVVLHNDPDSLYPHLDPFLLWPASPTFLLLLRGSHNSPLGSNMWTVAFPTLFAIITTSGPPHPTSSPSPLPPLLSSSPLLVLVPPSSSRIIIVLPFPTPYFDRVYQTLCACPSSVSCFVTTTDCLVPSIVGAPPSVFPFPILPSVLVVLFVYVSPFSPPSVGLTAPNPIKLFFHFLFLLFNFLPQLLLLLHYHCLHVHVVL